MNDLLYPTIIAAFALLAIGACVWDIATTTRERRRNDRAWTNLQRITEQARADFPATPPRITTVLIGPAGAARLREVAINAIAEREAADLDTEWLRFGGAR